MRLIKHILCVGWATGAMLGGLQAALPSHPVGTSIQVVDRMAVGRLTPVSMGQSRRVASRAESSVSASTVVGISGRPNQVYSIRLPHLEADRGAATLEHLTAWSDNAGALIATGQSTRMDANGRDVLRLNGDLHIPARYAVNGSTASMTLGIDYQ